MVQKIIPIGKEVSLVCLLSSFFVRYYTKVVTRQNHFQVPEPSHSKRIEHKQLKDTINQDLNNNHMLMMPNKQARCDTMI